MRKCPFCAEEIQDDAIQCKYCQEILQVNKHIIKKDDSRKSFINQNLAGGQIFRIIWRLKRFMNNLNQQNNRFLNSRKTTSAIIIIIVFIIFAFIYLFTTNHHVVKRKQKPSPQTFCQNVIFPYAAKFFETKEKFNGIDIHMGTSTTNILPLLEKFSEENKDFISSVYGQERRGYILISVNVNPFKDNNNYVHFGDILDAGDNLLKNIHSVYPCREGKLEFISNDIRIWDSILWEFKESKILSHEIKPDLSLIEQREKIYKNKQNKQHKSDFIVDLSKGMVGNLEIGKVIALNKLIEYIGEEPDQKQVDFIFGNVLKFFDLGFEIYYEKNQSSDDCRIEQIIIFPSNYDVSGEKYKAYRGEIVPISSKDLNLKTIFKEFGMPSQIKSSLLSDIEEHYYYKSWGNLVFCFDKNEHLLFLAFQKNKEKAM